MNRPYGVVVLGTFEHFLDASHSNRKKTSKQELRKLENFFDFVHEQREKRVMLLSDLTNHRGEVEARVRLFKMASTDIIAIND